MRATVSRFVYLDHAPHEAQACDFMRVHTLKARARPRSVAVELDV